MTSTAHPLAPPLIALLAIQCGGQNNQRPEDKPDADQGALRPEPSEDFGRNLLHYDLQINLADKRGIETLRFEGGSSTGLSLEKGNLVIEEVKDERGPLKFIDTGTDLHIGVPPVGGEWEVEIHYSFYSHTNFDGWLDDQKLSFLWPTFCKNLFPCITEPKEGASFSLDVTGADETIIYPRDIPAEAPSYMPGIAVGDYTKVVLGETSHGTEVAYYHLPGGAERSAAGTAHLLPAFEFLEDTYGPYLYGDDVAAVEVAWGPGGLGGLEHHPYWHVGSPSMSSEETQVHEAAHGWYGNGIRIECWEDFVLSEGVVTYMAARALAESGVDVWPEYDCQLKQVCNSSQDTRALVPTCGEIDILNHPLWSNSPYQKGAMFFLEVANLIGEAAVDEVLADFYATHKGKAARMEELIDALEAKGQAQEVDELAEIWLRSESCPVLPETLCPAGVKAKDQSDK